MQPLPSGPEPRPDSHPEIGAFRQGTPLSQWALARYLVGQAIGSYLRMALLVGSALVLVLAGLVYWLGPTWLATLILIIALCGLGLRAVLGGLLRRFAGIGVVGPGERRLRALVAETRGDVRRELRRIGAPSHPLTMPLLGLRLLGRRRAATVELLRSFDVERTVPPSRLDELHLLVDAARRDVPRAY